MADRVKADGYTYVPTELTDSVKASLAKGGGLMYESILERGQADAISRFQAAIDNAKNLKLDVAEIQVAFDQIAPRIMTGDLTREVPFEIHAKLSAKIGPIPKTGGRPALKIWSAKSRIVNQSVSLHDICDDPTDDLIEELLFPAIDRFLSK